MTYEQAEKTTRMFLRLAKINLERDRSLVPVAFLFKGEECAIMGLNFPNQKAKGEMGLLIAAKAAVMGADSVLYIADAYQRAFAKEEEIVVPEGGLRNDVQAMESVIAVWMCKDFTFTIALPYIHTEDKYHWMDEIPLPINRDVQVNLIPKFWDLSPEQLETAKIAVKLFEDRGKGKGFDA